MAKQEQESSEEANLTARIGLGLDEINHLRWAQANYKKEFQMDLTLEEVAALELEAPEEEEEEFNSPEGEEESTQMTRNQELQARTASAALAHLSLASIELPPMPTEDS